MPHSCMIDPEAGFPTGTPDVDRQGHTGRATGEPALDGPFTHDCRTCGERYIWREIAGMFVVWYPEGLDEFDREGWTEHVARVAAAPLSGAEIALHTTVPTGEPST